MLLLYVRTAAGCPEYSVQRSQRLAAWCPAVLTAPAHARCLATLSK
jgi:hypothetical protein